MHTMFDKTGAGLLLLLFLLQQPLSANANPTTELEQIAKLIFKNECASKDACLTSWNEGEEFASLGIGHFIWYPETGHKTFQESFPALITFMIQQGKQPPIWLANRPEQSNPWINRKAFLGDYNSQKMYELRDFLIHNKTSQAEFMQQRLRGTLPKMLLTLDQAAKKHVRQQFELVAASPMGMYVLMDYVNFKGEGTNLKERYQGKGWGMLQVLENMNCEKPGLLTIKSFADSADTLLSQRVKLSPAHRNEIRWLAGWRIRLNSYIRESEQLFNQSRL